MKVESNSGMGQKFQFVTGKLAEPMLRSVLAKVADELCFEYTIQVMPISVAALMTPAWIARRIQIPPGTQQIVLPGYCGGDLTPVHESVSIPVIVGPRDLNDLPEFLGGTRVKADLSHYDIEILAEINHAPRLSRETLVSQALTLAEQGADLIDLGCDPGVTWESVGECVQQLRDLGLRLSIDSFDPTEIKSAAKSGAELVLSVNKSNREFALDWGIEVVVVPDENSDWLTIADTMEFLDQHRVPFRIDPILEPIGVGLMNSLARYHLSRQRWPDVPMLMGIGNLTELSDVDSVGVNFVLIGIAQELRIRSVLTTQVINWAASSVRECDIARRLARYAVANRVPPKRLSNQLVMLRDTSLNSMDWNALSDLARIIRDNNVRIFTSDNQIVTLASGQIWHDHDPFVVFDKLLTQFGAKMAASHAFYLGYEMAKAELAIQLNKRYTQDESLEWGLLTREEKKRHRLSRRTATDPQEGD